MHRILYCTLFMIFFAACNTPLLEESRGEEALVLPANYYLRFDINDISYANEQSQDTTFVNTEQDLDFVFTLKNVNSLARYLYFTDTHTLPTDSVTLLGNIRFLQEPDTQYPEDIFDLEFVFTEALSNLEENADGTFNYLDRQLLAERLQNENWGHNELFLGHSINQMLLTLPVVQELPNGWGEMMMSSSGFYFPHETLEITQVTYLTEEDAVVISGGFTVELKILSCGFASFFSVRQATFRALIQ